MKRCAVVLLLLLSFALISAKENEAFANLSDLVSESSKKQLIYKHTIKSVSSEGDIVVFDNDMSFVIDWWYRPISQKWKVGDRVYAVFDFSNKKVKVENALSSEAVLASVQNRPHPLHTIQAMSNGLSEPDGFARIALGNGYVFKSVAQGFLNSNWELNDHVMILATSDHLYQLWNVERNYILEAEFVADRNQTGPKPIKIQNLWSMEDRLNAQILHQSEASKAVVASLFNYVAGINDKQKPVGVFLFIGPTGVGKTEMAKALTREIYNDSSQLVRFDMSHFAEPHSLARLIGAPRGYINHEEGGELTNPLAKNSQVVVLLDEIEKAHSQVRKFFLPVFDEGFILDTKSKQVSCKDTIFIMTSNLCATEIAKLYHLGHSSEEILAKIEPQLIEALSPELYSRVEPILFQPLVPETMKDLVQLMLGKLIKNILLEKEIQVHADDSLVHFLEVKGYHPLLGARPLKKLIEKRVVSRLAYHIVKEGAHTGDELTLSYDEEKDSVIVQRKPS